jgi:protein-S-isoprenylcysteine O-methyltransferase Ste14
MPCWWRFETSDETRESRDIPGVIAPPPLIYAGALATGLLANGRYPISFLPSKLARALGLSLVVVGCLLGLWGDRALRGAGTSVDPREPVTALVVGGPYRFTRNPLYLSITLVYAGISAFANALWALLLLPLVLSVMRRGVIEREERYLERKFGGEYLNYKERVRRWI